MTTATLRHAARSMCRALGAPFRKTRQWHSAVVLLALSASVHGAQTPRRATGAAPPAPPAELTSAALDRLPLRLVGPSSPSGRVWQVVGDPAHPKVFYACTAQGGVWRTTNFGTTIAPIMDEENAASCGAIALSPADPAQIWVGTGEPAARQSNAIGHGVYKSTDGGRTWQHLGLTDTQQIAAIVVHPTNPDTAFVGAMGHLWGRNVDRGVFKTVDGGRTWTKVLFVDDMTGAIDLQMDPHDANVLYASMWQRMRSGGSVMRESGPGSGLYKSTDAGATWTKIMTGLPTEPLSKMTLAVAKRTPGRLFAYVLSGEARRGGRTSDVGGIFRSDDGGASWRRVSPKLSSRTYYTHIVIDPSNDDRLWIMDLVLWRSDDAGVTWAKHNMSHVHDDLHSLWIDPTDPERLVLGGDGGINTTVDGGRSWAQSVMPLAQFYDVAVDNQDPYFVYGGMQDTASWAGPSRTYDFEGITDHDWFKLRDTGDGMAIHPDPRDPTVIYLAQEDGNLSRLDLRTWTRTELQPTQALAKTLGLPPFRWDWTPPMILSAPDPATLYFGANHVFRCTMTTPRPNGEMGHTCTVISPDLTRQQQTPFPPVGEGYHSYGALSAIAESPVDPQVLWAGSDDGWVHVSRTAGTSWSRVDEAMGPGGHVEGAVMTIEPSRVGAGSAYVVFDTHYKDDNRPYVFKTTDYGKSWTSLTATLPAWGCSYVIREDPHNARVLYLGTESGLFVTVDGGAHWSRWKGTLPHVGVRSLAIHARDKEIVVGTFGRSIWVGDVSVIEQFAAGAANAVHLFDPKPATAFNVRYTYGTDVEEVNGDLFFRAANPPYGVRVDYFLRDASPGPVRVLVKDAAGTVLRSLEGGGRAGLNSVQWDLESDQAINAYDASKPNPAVETLSAEQRARRVAPGRYTLTLEVPGATMSKPVTVRGESGARRPIRVR
ncbi:MAG: hypothetical protein U0Q12_24850 [Vicinamibacterales bacterium]